MPTRPLDNELTVTSSETTTAPAAEIQANISSPEKQSRKITVTLAFLSGCIALIMTGFGIIIPVFPQRLESLGLGAETLALMEVGFGLGMFLFSPVLGTLADRIGRKPVVLLSLAGFILTNLVLAVVNVPLLFILVRFIEGVVASGMLPAATAMVGDSIPPERQGRWLGMITTAQASGVALGPAIGGFLYQVWGFITPFLLSAAIALAASLLALFMLKETLPAHVRAQAQQRRADRQEQRGRRIFAVDLAALNRSRILQLFGLLLFFDFSVAFAYPFVLPEYPFFFEKVLHYTSAQYGTIVSVYGLSLAVFPMFLGRLSELAPKKLLIALGCLLIPVLNIGMLFLHQFALLIAATVVTGLGSALFMPALSVVYLGKTTEQNRSQVMGIRGSALSLAILLGPLALALFSRWLTPHATFAIAAAIPLLVLLLIPLLSVKRSG
ncbi:MAG: MFS transporter [Ktedonobacteraceae bacterium]|nr:MFS transporter [Ktedonobacteraceae bacterium]